MGIDFPGRTVALLNSRKPRSSSPASRWVRLTRILASRAAASGATLVSGLGPLHHDLALRAALDAGGRAVVVLGPAAPRPARVRLDYRAVLESPAVVVHAAAAASQADRDRRVSALAGAAVVVEARHGGVTETVALERLERGAELFVCPADGTPDTRGNRRLLDAGAIPLEPAMLALDEAALRRALEAHPPPRRPVAPHAAPVRGRPAPWIHVMHFTRACRGPFPGETRWDYVGALARSDDPEFRSGLATLGRILREGRIRAGSRLIRGGHRVVCMTDSHPAEVAVRARWTRHLVRWSFEAYAVGLRRDGAPCAGIRPAIYAHASEFESIPAAERHRFQRHEPPGVDWSSEREWRAAGDVDLSSWAEDDALVLVPTEEEARVARAWTRFQVVAIDGGSEQRG